MKPVISDERQAYWQNYIQSHPAFDANWHHDASNHTGMKGTRTRLKNLINRGNEEDVWKIAHVLFIIRERDYEIVTKGNISRWHDIADFHQLFSDFDLAEQQDLDNWLLNHMTQKNVNAVVIENLIGFGATATPKIVDLLIAHKQTDIIETLLEEEKISFTNLEQIAEIYLEKGEPGKKRLDTLMDLLPRDIRHEILAPYTAYENKGLEWSMVDENTVIRMRNMLHHLTCFEVYDFYAEEIKYISEHKSDNGQEMSETVRNFNDLARPKEVLGRAANALRNLGGDPEPHAAKKSGKSVRPPRKAGQ